MAVLEITAIRDHLNISGTASDTELLEFAGRAEMAVASRCGPLARTAVTTKVRGYGRSLTPRVTPILSVESVTPLGGLPVALGALATPEQGLRGASTIEYLSGATFGARWYEVSYTAGRDPVPDDLRLAVLEALRYYWSTQRGTSGASRLRRPTGQDGEPLGTELLHDGFPWPRVQHLIEPYEQVWL